MLLLGTTDLLGHVDSGKTSLSKALSTVASTASFDKNPQSKERGITLDLGFSSFTVEIPEHLQGGGHEQLQYTLVDCPGHAGLIRTIIGGAQIIDLMILVVDIVKGMQTQTAECLVIGQIACNKMIVVLNKVDLIPEAKREATVEKMKKKMTMTLKNTKFAGCPIVPVAAKPGGPEGTDTEGMGVQELIDTLKLNTYLPQRSPEGDFIFAVDHCFSIRGQGTVMTGTVLHGSIAVNDTVEIPSMKVIKKIKSMQMFKQPIDKIKQGDRAGVCVTQFDPKLLERGLVCTQGVLPTIIAAIVSVEKIPYFKGTISTKAKFHITMGHETVMGRVSFFGETPIGNNTENIFDTSGSVKAIDYTKEYLYMDELHGKGDKKSNEGSTEESSLIPSCQYALIELEKPVICSRNCLVIGSRLDTDIHSNTCRLAFHGQLLEAITDPKYPETILPKLKVYKNKLKEGIVERLADDYSVICRGLFKKESNIELFVGLKVTLSTGESGTIEGGFGQSGKFKVRIPNGVEASTKEALTSKKKAKGKSKNKESTEASTATEEPQVTITLSLAFKRYIYDPKKLMKQT
ncbi:unnamed protein product [Owenia fusiformis]|uniref:Selenocysteine-specific elongation factor n=1 Tax=Owenia fusiformis TaxID=6347 RepID=A0A8S4NXN8_OWEFU|nr:unnamed protein product [Owenia fusiformis]